jgi:hypothetical protein
MRMLEGLGSEVSDAIVWLGTWGGGGVACHNMIACSPIFPWRLGTVYEDEWMGHGLCLAFLWVWFVN